MEYSCGWRYGGCVREVTICAEDVATAAERLTTRIDEDEPAGASVTYWVGGEDDEDSFVDIHIVSQEVA